MNLVAVALFLLAFSVGQIFIANSFLKLQVRIFSAVGGVIASLLSTAGIITLILYIFFAAVIPYSRERWKHILELED